MIEQLIKRIGNIECWIRDLKENGTGSGGITLPSGGNNGDVLVKEGAGLDWATPSSGGGMILSTTTIIVEENGQEYLLNAFPVGKSVFSVQVEGVPQILNVDYEIESNSIKWISADPAELVEGYVVNVVYY